MRRACAQEIDCRIEAWIAQIARKVDMMLNDVAVETKKHDLDLVTNIDKEVQAILLSLSKRITQNIRLWVRKK